MVIAQKMVQFIQAINAAEQDQVIAEDIEILIRKQLARTIFNTAGLRELLAIANRLNLTNHLQSNLHYDLSMSYRAKHEAVFMIRK